MLVEYLATESSTQPNKSPLQRTKKKCGRVEFGVDPSCRRVSLACGDWDPNTMSWAGNPTAGAVRASERIAVNVRLPFVIARCMTRHYSRAQMRKLLILASLLLAGCSRSS